jgi:hypothetical protein
LALQNSSGVRKDTVLRPIWYAAILASVIIHLVLWPLSEPPILFSDFFKAYWVAAEHLWNNGLSATYPFTIRGNWSNLPVLAWPFALLVPFGREAAAWIYLGIGYLTIAATWLMLVRLARLRTPMAAALACLFLLNGPLLNALREGNSTHFVLFFLVLGLWLWEERQEFASGLALGLSAAIKPPLLLLGVYFLLRRRWPIVAGGAATIAVVALSSLALFGYAAHLEWYNETVGFNLGKAMPAFNVQSIDGFLIRLQTGATEMLYWGPLDPTPLHKAARLTVIAAIIGFFAWMMIASERRGETAPRGAPGPHDFMQFSVLLIVALVISPLSWNHYYIYLLVPAALVVGDRLPGSDDVVTRVLFWTGYVFASLPVIMPDFTTLRPEPPQTPLMEIFAVTLVSSWVFGAFIMLSAFVRGGWLTLRHAEPAGDLPSEQRA